MLRSEIYQQHIHITFGTERWGIFWKKFQWEDDEGEDYYFEMAIRIDDLTKEVALIITDFHEDDEDELRLLWDNNIHKLKQAIGG